jgi:hypothetical protein
VEFRSRTGPHLLAIKGDAGIDTSIAPIKLELDLDFNDMHDLTESLFGFGGYATNGKWRITGKVGKLQLEDDAVKGSRRGNTLSAHFEFDYTQAELTIGYPLVKKSSFAIYGYSGLRYSRQEVDLSITGTGFFGVNCNKSIDESWTDVLVGVSVGVTFAEKWNWNIKADAGFGGSEGTYNLLSMVTWRFYGNWSGTISGQYLAVDYENSSKGASDWYLYDIAETTLGMTIMYNW